jgi:hypothetical protein
MGTNALEPDAKISYSCCLTASAILPTIVALSVYISDYESEVDLLDTSFSYCL